MANQTGTPPGSPSAEVVGNVFVDQYYHILHRNPELVHKFYKDYSFLGRPDHNGVMTSVTTMKSIDDKIRSLDYENCEAEIETADAQPSHNGGVIVLVTGFLTRRDNWRRKFMQTFFLAPQERGYFVLNDVFRYVEVREPGQNAATMTVVGSNSPSLAEDQEPAHVNTSKGAHDVKEEERQVNNKEENDKHYPADLESRTSDPEEAPKKSYASIVSTQTRKGPVQVYVPAGTSKAALVKTEKQVVDLAAQVSEASAPTAASSVTHSESKASEDEAQGYSIYIGNLPPRITVHQLETEFQKFGRIKQNGVQVRQSRIGAPGFCFGFVEFEDLSSMQNAIQASPITIGNHETVIEMKRTTMRGGSGWNRFSTGRGLLRNDSFRGRGNFGGGRGYERNDYGRRTDFQGQSRSQGGGGGRGYDRNDHGSHMEYQERARSQGGEEQGRGRGGGGGGRRGGRGRRLSEV